MASLFETEQVVLATARDDGELSQSPRTLVAVGSSVLAVGYDAGDAFPELRALTWKRAGFVAPGGIHVHESPSLLSVIRCRDEADARTLLGATLDGRTAATSPARRAGVRAQPKRDERRQGWNAHRTARYIEALAAGRPLGAELWCDDWNEATFVDAKQRLGVDLPTTPRLQVMFYGVTRSNRRDASRAMDRGGRARSRGCVLIKGLRGASAWPCSLFARAHS